MHCVIYITTKQPVNDYRQNLINIYLSKYTTNEIFDRTSLNGETDILESYFYGSITRNINFLLANDTSNRIKIFIETIDRRNSITHLEREVSIFFKDFIKLLKKHKIQHTEIKASISSEGEDLLFGEYEKFSTKFKSYLPEIPAGMYLLILTGLYTFIEQLLKDYYNKSPFCIQELFWSTMKNITLVFLSIIFWLVIKACNTKSNLSFKINK
jgi:hypothetical protein